MRALSIIKGSSVVAEVTRSSIPSNLRASPPLYLSNASSSFTSMCLSLSIKSFVKARWSSSSRSAFSKLFSTYTWQRDKRGRITSNEGFSVVAPIKVMAPVSTAARMESCCDFEKRWISSMNRIGLCWLKKRLVLAFSITSRTSFTPLLTAESV